MSSLSGSDSVDPSSATASDLFGALRSTFQEVLGDAGWGSVASTLSVLFFSPATRLAIVRCPAATEEECRACVSLVKVVRRRAAAIHILKCVSTVKRLKEALQNVSAGIAQSLRVAQGATGVLGEAFFAKLEEEANEAI